MVTLVILQSQNKLTKLRRRGRCVVSRAKALERTCQGWACSQEPSPWCRWPRWPARVTGGAQSIAPHVTSLSATTTLRCHVGSRSEPRPFHRCWNGLHYTGDDPPRWYLSLVQSSECIDIHAHTLLLKARGPPLGHWARAWVPLHGGLVVFSVYFDHTEGWTPPKQRLFETLRKSDGAGASGWWQEIW